MRSFFITSLLIILSLFFSQSASAQGLQCQPFLELTGPCLEGVFSGEIASGSTIQAAFDRVVAFLQTDLGITVGRKVPHKDLGCVQIKGMNVSLTYDDGRKSEHLVREFGDIRGRQGYTVSFFIDRMVKRGTKEFQEVYDMSVWIALESITPELELTAGKDTLSVGEQTKITAKLHCGECPLAREEISFQVKQGPARVSPPQSSTNPSGEAHTIFTAEKEGEAVVCASYQTHGEELVTQCVEILILGKPLQALIQFEYKYSDASEDIFQGMTIETKHDVSKVVNIRGEFRPIKNLEDFNFGDGVVSAYELKNVSLSWSLDIFESLTYSDPGVSILNRTMTAEGSGGASRLLEGDYIYLKIYKCSDISKEFFGGRCIYDIVLNFGKAADASGIVTMTIRWSCQSLFPSGDACANRPGWNREETETDVISEFVFGIDTGPTGLSGIYQAGDKALVGPDDRYTHWNPSWSWEITFPEPLKEVPE